jgi:hypothetical protein
MEKKKDGIKWSQQNKTSKHNRHNYFIGSKKEKRKTQMMPRKARKQNNSRRV